MSEKIRILLITSGQPSLNPRLVKEADTLANAGYNVTVLYSYWNNWGTNFDRELIPGKSWRAVRVGGDPKSERILFLFSKLLHKLAKQISKLTGGRLLSQLAVARSAWFLKIAAKKNKADLYIGHNLGALMPTVIGAKHNGKPSIFDAEDFHRHEVSDNMRHHDVVLKTKIENDYLPLVKHFTASSNAIADAYQELFPTLKPQVLLNVFPMGNVKRGASNINIVPLKLFWFSQTIGPNRGIEDVVKALQLLDKDRFELHLLGHQPQYSNAFFDFLTESGVNITFHHPIAPDAIIEFAARFDIGLALESGFNLNNHLALSNKIFTYLQAGLAVIATDTTSQKAFMQDNPEIGRLYRIGNYKQLAEILSEFLNNKETLAACKSSSFCLAREKYNWDIEQVKFLALIEKALSTHY